ncbi:MAG: T9SS type A sorting domain-containing protein [Bacteroidetes bacterium]|nr:T9SS type A sorting domain-containing protein [Bacteroidota bacterium]MBU1678039.1 T9SS type A sorting domain-containing protein [Bacteroidota bacterium]
MRKLFLITLITLLFATIINAQDLVFFDDSPTNVSYDASWGYNNAPSFVERVGEKFPVSEGIKYLGTNSLKLHWKSASGGDWGIAVAAVGWPGSDVTTKDTLTFWFYADSAFATNDLPKIFLEDLSNRKTDKQNLSNFAVTIQANVWSKISIPIQVFKNFPGTADLTKIKTVYYGQGISDGFHHTMYLDEIRMKSAGGGDSEPPVAPVLLFVKGFNKHIDLKWVRNSEVDLDGYYIYKYNGTTPVLLSNVKADEQFFTDFVGGTDVSAEYAISAYDLSGNESGLSNSFSASTKFMTDDEMLDMLQESTFRYFWDYAHPVSGLTRERHGSKNTVTSGGSGFGIMAVIVGIERGFISREEGAARILKISNFLKNADRFHGAWSHWLNGETGKAIPFSQYDDAGDLVETAFLIQGLLTAREYFINDDSVENEIRTLITELWETVEWEWYRRSEGSNVLFWHWSPNYEWQMNMPIKGFNETMIVYLLAIASPTHGVPASLYHNGWVSSNYLNGKTFYGIKQFVGPDYGGPLFFTHYSYLGFDPRNKKDSYTNYFINNRNIALIHNKYCEDNPMGYTGYSADTWGLTASDDPYVGYLAHEPMNRDNGTLSPTAALSSMPYTPTESMAAFKSFYNTYGEDLWGSYGFKDAFNPGINWTAGSFLAIDQGPIIIMVENYRSALLWDLFMANPEIQPMLDAIGFITDTTTAVEDDIHAPLAFELIGNYPNPFNPSTRIKYSIPNTSDVKLEVFNLIGEKIATLVNEVKQPGTYEVSFNAGNLSSGVYFYKISTNGFSDEKKLMLLK